MITIGIIGCGRIADSAHMPAFEKMDDVRVKYACDVIEGKAEAFIARHPKAEKAVLDYREVLADPEVDAVYVLTPNYAHYEVTMAALGQGRFLRKADNRKLRTQRKNGERSRKAR